MNWQILAGKAEAVLPTLPERHFHCCVTSPPYWGLRDYGVEGQLGCEKTPEEYVANMVRVFAQVRRCLRGDSTLWLNIGDSYADSRKSNEKREKDASGVTRPSKTANCERCGTEFEGGIGRRFCSSFCGGSDNSRRSRRPGGLKAKDLVGIPWMLAFALRADGWYLRAENIWHKPNAMTESVKDRPARCHEQVFLLSKSPRYFYDAYAVMEATAESTKSDRRIGGAKKRNYQNAAAKYGNGTSAARRCATNAVGDKERRGLRSVWRIPTKSFKGAHFATFPPALAERCLLAGTSEHGCCPHCGTPHKRLVERRRVPTRPGADTKVTGNGSAVTGNRDPERHVTKVLSLGWEQNCPCAAAPPTPCRVLDPFSGAGTTVMVALRLGRSATGVELNPEYAEMARKRVIADIPLFNTFQE